MGDTVETEDGSLWVLWQNQYMKEPVVFMDAGIMDVDLTRADLVALLALIDQEETNDE